MNAILETESAPEFTDLGELDQARSDAATKPEILASSKAPIPGRSRRARLIAAAAVAALLVSSGYYWRFVAPYESTDDAFIETDVTPIAPQVSGRVLRVLVSDNQNVEKGAVLFEIDPRDFQATLDQARAELAAARGRAAQADAQLSVDRAKVAEERAGVTAAEAEAMRAEDDYRRYRDAGSLAVSASQVDLAATQASSSAAQVTVARNRQLSMEAQTVLDEADIQTARAEVIRGEAAVRQAELNLSYTRVVAPVAGFVTHRGVQPGDYAQTAQPQLAIVPRQVWVVANFKETQLTRMRPGQPVEVSVDAYPRLKIRGHVDSIQSGSGARFSLFPPENASGNYVKVVQRVPVKIVLDDAQGAQVLGPGMSVVPEVRVR
ncbi:MAG: HlyD family secretion protein [Opitutaceae bacterium]|jgi:membrane fusion protein (multidrug efflux system)